MKRSAKGGARLLLFFVLLQMHYRQLIFSKVSYATLDTVMQCQSVILP